MTKIIMKIKLYMVIQNLKTLDELHLLISYIVIYTSLSHFLINVRLITHTWISNKEYKKEKRNRGEIEKIYGWTHEPSSHSGSMKFPPPFTAGIHDFFGAAATATITLQGLTTAPTLPPMPAARRAWLLFPPHKKWDPNPFNTALDVAAAITLSPNYSLLEETEAAGLEFSFAKTHFVILYVKCEKIRGCSHRMPCRTMKSIEEISNSLG